MNPVIHDLKDSVRHIQIGVSLLPLGAATPEMVAALRKCNEELAALLPSKPVRHVTRKPTAADIALHQAKMRMSGVSPGIEPYFNRRYLRSVRPAE